MVAALLCDQAVAGPLAPRKGRGAEVASEIVKIFGEIFKGAGLAFPEKTDAWYAFHQHFLRDGH
jgi:hypothetical protein